MAFTTTVHVKTSSNKGALLNYRMQKDIVRRM